MAIRHAAQASELEAEGYRAPELPYLAWVPYEARSALSAWSAWSRGHGLVTADGCVDGVHFFAQVDTVLERVCKAGKHQLQVTD